MGIAPREFLAVAESLGEKQEATEAELRTAVGRLYYALYNIALRRLVAIDEIEDRPYDVHSNLINAVRGIRRNIGDQLDRLRDMRTHADYKLSATDFGFKREYCDWKKNFSDAHTIASRLAPHLETLQRK